jgi:hypothetical protein
MRDIRRFTYTHNQKACFSVIENPIKKDIFVHWAVILSSGQLFGEGPEAPQKGRRA